MSPSLLPKATNVTFIAVIYSAAELAKAVSKRVPKLHTFELTLDEPFDTFKAQLLAKISASLNLPQLDLAHYEIMCTVPRFITKPGMPVLSETDYAAVLGYVRRAATKEPPFADRSVD